MDEGTKNKILNLLDWFIFITGLAIMGLVFGIDLTMLYLATDPQKMMGTLEFLFWEIDKGFFLGFATTITFFSIWFIRYVPKSAIESLKERGGL